jgi:hypothetical protein
MRLPLRSMIVVVDVFGTIENSAMAAATMTPTTVLSRFHLIMAGQPPFQT